MTVDYLRSIHTSSRIGCFWRVLWRWKGSMYKLLLIDLMIYLGLYYLIWIIYRTALNDEQQKDFQNVIKTCKQYLKLIPVSFLLGFFVTQVINRWWNQCQSIPSPSSLSVYVSSTLHGQDEVARAMRRTIVRYAVASISMVFRKLSPRVKKRFPKFADYVTVGLLHENEVVILEDFIRAYPKMALYWLPIVWAATVAGKARQLGKIRSDQSLQTIINELNKIRGSCGGLSSYLSVGIPLVYTQVVTIAVYSYLLTALLSDMDITSVKEVKDERIGIYFGYFPFYVILQFVFYMGWLKVAEQLMNPFGDDEDDFKLNPMIDKNLQMAYLIVDDMHNEHPVILRDMYWEEMPTELPDKGRESTDVKETKDSKRNSTDTDNYVVYPMKLPRKQSLDRRQSLGAQKVKINIAPSVVDTPSQMELSIDPDLMRTSGDTNTDTGEEELEPPKKNYNGISTVSGKSLD